MRGKENWRSHYPRNINTTKAETLAHENKNETNKMKKRKLDDDENNARGRIVNFVELATSVPVMDDRRGQVLLRQNDLGPAGLWTRDQFFLTSSAVYK